MLGDAAQSLLREQGRGLGFLYEAWDLIWVSVHNQAVWQTYSASQHLPPASIMQHPSVQGAKNHGALASHTPLGSSPNDICPATLLWDQPPYTHHMALTPSLPTPRLTCPLPIHCPQTADLCPDPGPSPARQDCDPWMSLLQSSKVLDQVLWLADNTLDTALLERSWELLASLLRAGQGRLAGPLLAGGLLDKLTSVLDLGATGMRAKVGMLEHGLPAIHKCMHACLALEFFSHSCGLQVS